MVKNGKIALNYYKTWYKALLMNHVHRNRQQKE